MYKQNASRDTCFEALIVRVPWPEWSPSSSAPATTTPSSSRSPSSTTPSGYDSECAVLFPETFSTAERPPSHFGAIFCDREAERFRRVCGARRRASCGLNLPPDAACLLASPRALPATPTSLWDLIHDRTHMHGDLPFDPFMIRQRSPYWMYSLEELRCDLTAFGEAVEARARGLRASPATSSTRSSSTASSASRSPARGSATTTASAASCCSPSSTARATCTGPTTA